MSGTAFARMSYRRRAEDPEDDDGAPALHPEHDSDSVHHVLCQILSGVYARTPPPPIVGRVNASRRKDARTSRGPATSPGPQLPTSRPPNFVKRMDLSDHGHA
jgi:hypothetical protein